MRTFILETPASGNRGASLKRRRVVTEDQLREWFNHERIVEDVAEFYIEPLGHRVARAFEVAIGNPPTGERAEMSSARISHWFNERLDNGVLPAFKASPIEDLVSTEEPTA